MLALAITAKLIKTAGWVDDLALLGFDHVDDGLHNGRWREKFTAIMGFIACKLC